MVQSKQECKTALTSQFQYDFWSTSHGHGHSHGSWSIGHAWAKRQRHKSLSKLEVRARRAPSVMVKLYSIPWPCQIRDELPCLLHFEESLGVFGLIYLRNFLNSECAVILSL